MYSNLLAACIKADGQVLREKGENVYLPFGTNYSVYIKNLNSRRVKVGITIDNEDILDGNSLIIDPNSDVDLSRWLSKDKNKGPALKFIEKTEEIREYRGDNNGLDGIVRITYQFEALSLPFQTITTYPPPTWTDWSWSTTNFKCGSVGSSNNLRAMDSASYTTNTNASLSSVNDEGMTIKGEVVDQKFKTATIYALDPQVFVMCFVLKGETNEESVVAPIKVKEKIKCSKCGKKNSTKNNFCSVCGNNLL